jgi:hypothetical protein
VDPRAGQHALNIGCNGKYIEESVNKKFLGFQTDNHLNWTNRINKVIPKLSGACYADRPVCVIINTDSFKPIYFACFHCTLMHGIIWGEKSSNSKKIFTLQKKVVRLMAGVKPKNSCKSLFKSLEILTLPR